MAKHSKLAVGWARSLALGALVTAVSAAGLTVAPAAAATEMYVDLTMREVSPGAVFADYYAFIPTDSGWGYLNNGASITVTCYGVDAIRKERLFTKVHSLANNSAQQIWATAAGVDLIASQVASKGGLFDEDRGAEEDEVQCELKWLDADGGTMTRWTAMERGFF
ncbi:hypothetical protein [Kribbella ginsengisoli]|uniref:Uncharacterized protein n=1 Tax=Kribbella ginsengisoli TaxID=363865 RepID=A0ABP6ZCW6_9ACTN